MATAYAAESVGAKLEKIDFNPGKPGAHQVLINVESCGICHSDLSVLHNEWGISQFPLVPGHEVVGTIAEVGEHVSHLKPGQRVGVGWLSGSCMHCQACMSGDHNLCSSAEATIIGRFGGFADQMIANAEWTIPIPENIDALAAGPLFCGGITVFNPIVQLDIKPTDKVGVIGIGGLGHMAVQFLDAWGCEVTAFSSSADKHDEARNMGADHFVNSRDAEALEKAAGTLDCIISTVNVPLDWMKYINALRPKGKLHFVGAVLEPLTVPVFPLLAGQKSISASPLGSPATTVKMLEFVARHGLEPIIETFPMAQVNEALDKLQNGSPRYRIVLKN